MQSISSPIQQYLEELHESCAGDRSGAVADYIPELAAVEPEHFGIALATTDGRVYEVGDTDARFTIQSTSKPLSYGLALEDKGVSDVTVKIGVEPSGDAFNSISLQPGSGRPLNPMINAGAIAATSLIAGEGQDARLGRILDCYSRYAGRALEVDQEVYESERSTGHRNRAIGHMLRTFGILIDDPEAALDLYFRQCAVAVDCRDLSMIAATLANGGVNPASGERALSAEHVDRVLSVMTTCGMYDGAGEWVVGIGMPAKSGVSGGIMAVLPGQLGIGVFSPRLDPVGNSVRGVEVCRRLSADLDLHFLSVARSARSSVRAQYDIASVPSKRRRAPSEREVLATHGGRTIVLELQGDLVFAAVESVVRELADRSDELDLAVIDLRYAAAVGNSADRLLEELAGAFAAEGKQIVIVERGANGSGGAAERFDDLDRAIEWCESRTLERHGSGVGLYAVGLAAHELCAGLSPEQLYELEASLEMLSFKAGDVLVRAGSVADSIYLITRGEVTVTVERDEGRALRVSTLVAGMTMGEAAMLDNEPRSATVTADTDGVMAVLPVGELDRMRSSSPELYATVVRNLLTASHRTVTRLSRVVASLSAA